MFREVIALLVAVAGARAQETPDQTDNPHDVHRYITEPEILPQVINIQHMPDPSALDDGYIFMAPSVFYMGWGPKIYRPDGMLIWDGNYTTGLISQNFDACSVGGTSYQHLCWHEASKLGGEAKKANPDDLIDHNRIFDNTYTQVKMNFTSTGELNTPPDTHEFKQNGSTFLQIVYPRKGMNMTLWTGPEEGVVQDSCFQEVDTDTGEPIYTWCYLDHLELETNIYVKSDKQTNFTTDLGGFGGLFSPWDFYHLNSVAKNGDGDYLLSGRHADQVMLVAGPDSLNGEEGEPLWRLGGPSNQFKFENDFNFTRQHDARFVSVNKTHTVITLFDNAWEGEAPKGSSQWSSGKLIAINNETMTARLIQQYPQPHGELCRMGGSVQMLDSGNLFIGWGYIREISEYHINGTLLYHATLRNSEGKQVNNYRDFKHPWVGKPAYPPKLVAYSKSCNRSSMSPLMAYVSWNGATEVAKWRFHTSEFAKGPFTSADTFEKKTFETRAHLSNYYAPYVRVQALDRRGNVLGETVRQTFVPSKAAQEMCDDDGCWSPETLDYGDEWSCAGLCQAKMHGLALPFLLVIICIEMLGWLYSKICCLQSPDGLNGIPITELKRQNGRLNGLKRLD